MRLAAMLCSLMVAGCGGMSDLTKKGAEVNDDAVQAAEFAICYGASVGAIRRAYGDRPEVWRELCETTDEWVID